MKAGAGVVREEESVARACCLQKRIPYISFIEVPYLYCYIIIKKHTIITESMCFQNVAAVPQSVVRGSSHLEQYEDGGKIHV